MNSLLKIFSWIGLLAFTTNGYVFSQDDSQWRTLFVTGYNVNVREAPELKAEVLEKVNWGTEFRARRYDDNWFQVLSWDEINIHFIHSDYLLEFNEFAEKAERLSSRNSLTELLLMDHFIKKQAFIPAINLAIKLIERQPEETIITGFERCELVSYSAYRKITDPKNNIVTKELKRAVNNGELTNPVILNLIDLAEVEDLIRDRGYSSANRLLREILEERSDFLSIEVGCEYDCCLKTYPEVWLKKLYFINYHLMAEASRKEVRRYLRDASKKWEDGRRKEIASDIETKLDVFSRN